MGNEVGERFGAFALSPIATCICDAASEAVLFANDAFAARVGRARAELAGMKLAALEGEARSRGVRFEAISARETDAGRALLVVHWLEAPDARAAELRRLQAILDHVADGISVTAADGTSEYVSPAVTRLFGYAPEEIMGGPAGILTHPDDLSAVTAQARAIRSTPGATCRVVSRNKRKDGTWVWIEAMMTNLLHEPGVRALVTNFRDVSEQVATLEALKQSQANFRALIDGLPAAVFVHRDDRIVYVNRAALTLLRYERTDELVGRLPLSLVADEYRDKARARAARLEREPGHPSNPSADGEMIRSDGTRVSVQVFSQKLDFDGAPAILVMAIDLTERKEMLARLATAERMAALGALAAGVAHEINNPLTYVLTNLSLLEGELPALLDGNRGRLRASDVAQLLRDAREGALRMRGVVRDLQSLSRTDEDQVGTVDVREVLESCLKMTQNELRYRARLVKRYDDVPSVEGNASRLGQVFLNLLINAIHAMPDGAVDANELRVSVERGGAGEIVVSIGDTGAGIAPENMSRIFDPFFTTKPMGQGTGLGLAICHGIVRAMRGEIRVESEVGRGTTFRVTLPAAVQREATPPPEEAPPTRHGRILVVDDEPSMGRTLQLLLRGEHDVTALTRAREALERIEGGERFDAILCDLMMPEMSGMRLFDEIRRVDPALAERVVFLTGGAFTPTAREFLEQVRNARLEKPFHAAELRAVLSDMLG